MTDPRTATTPTGSGNGVDVGRTSPPSMSLSGINSTPVTAGRSSRHPHNPPYLADPFAQTYNPYADNRVPYRYADPGPNSTGGIPNFSVPSGSGVGPLLSSHSQNDSTGSSEPLLGVNLDIETSPDSAIPFVPPRNPLRLMGGAGDTPRDAGRRFNGRSSDNESTSYRDDDDVEYGALRTGSLKVHSETVDPMHIFNCLRPLLGSK